MELPTVIKKQRALLTFVCSAIYAPKPQAGAAIRTLAGEADIGWEGALAVAHNAVGVVQLPRHHLPAAIGAQCGGAEMVAVQVVYHAHARNGSAQRHPRPAVVVVFGDGGDNGGGGDNGSVGDVVGGDQTEGVKVGKWASLQVCKCASRR